LFAETQGRTFCATTVLKAAFTFSDKTWKIGDFVSKELNKVLMKSFDVVVRNIAQVGNNDFKRFIVTYLERLSIQETNLMKGCVMLLGVWVLLRVKRGQSQC